MDFKRLRWLISEIPEARMRVERARSQASKITQTLSDMPHGSGVSSKVETGIILAERMQEKLDALVQELNENREVLQGAIEKMQDEQRIQMLTMRYIHGLPVSSIAEIMGYGEQRIFQILRDAEGEVNMITGIDRIYFADDYSQNG